MDNPVVPISLYIFISSAVKLVKRVSVFADELGLVMIMAQLLK